MLARFKLLDCLFEFMPAVWALKPDHIDVDFCHRRTPCHAAPWRLVSGRFVIVTWSALEALGGLGPILLGPLGSLEALRLLITARASPASGGFRGSFAARLPARSSALRPCVTI